MKNILILVRTLRHQAFSICTSDGTYYKLKILYLKRLCKLQNMFSREIVFSPIFSEVNGNTHHNTVHKQDESDIRHPLTLEAIQFTLIYLWSTKIGRFLRTRQLLFCECENVWDFDVLLFLQRFVKVNGQLFFTLVILLLAIQKRSSRLDKAL